MVSPDGQNRTSQKNPQQQVIDNHNQLKISKFGKTGNEGGPIVNKSNLNPRSSLNFSLEDSRKDSWYLESGQKPEHK